jgi:hypothetical protein
MKNRILLCLVINCLFNSFLIKAGGIAGGDLTYEFIGNDQYKVTLNLIRDCSNEPAPDTVNLDVSSSSCSFSTTYILLPGPLVPDVITEFPCPDILSTCNGGNAYGAQQWKYFAVIYLPTHCPDWIFSVHQTGRADGLTTILQNQDFYIEAILNNDGQDNSTPYYSMADLTFTCINQPGVIPQALADPEGDSLVFSFIDVRTDGNTPVNYQTGYSGLNPLSSTPPATIDALNGDIYFYNTIYQYAVIGVGIYEYRNGNLIAYSERNMVVVADTCQLFDPPTLLNNLPQPMYIEANVPFCFDFYSSDSDPNDTITMTGNVSNLPGATFTVSHSAFPSGTLCWTPADSDTSSQPYNFTIQLVDNSCPGNSVFMSFGITVTPFTGMNDPLTEKDVYLINDKTNGRFTVHSSILFVEKIKVYSSLGKSLFEQKNSSSFDLMDEQTGIYFVEVKLSNGMLKTFKLIKY